MTPKLLRRSTLFTALCTSLLMILPPVATAEEIELRFGHAGQTTEPLHVLGTKWSELLANRGQGKISMKLYPQGQLGDEKSLAEQLQLGTVDATMIAADVLVGSIPEIAAIGLPYAFTSFEEANKFLDGPGGQLLFREMEAVGLKGVGFVGVGFRSIGNKVRPIRRPEDLNGLKIREIPSPLILDTIEAIGGNAIPIPWADTIPALEQGVVDGVGTGPSFFWSAQLWEYCKYFSYTRHSFTGNVVLISSKTFNELGPDLQKILLETGSDAVAHTREHVIDVERELTANLEAEGIAVNTPDLAPFRQLVDGVWRSHESKIGPELMGYLRDTAGE